jgi:hypothetical protein
MHGDAAGLLAGCDLLHSRKMTAHATKDAERALGRNPDRLTNGERQALVGKYIALEIYSPEVLPLRRIEAIGDSMADCVRTLKSRGLDPLNFEFTRLGKLY